METLLFYRSTFYNIFSEQRSRSQGHLWLAFDRLCRLIRHGSIVRPRGIAIERVGHVWGKIAVSIIKWQEDGIEIFHHTITTAKKTRAKKVRLLQLQVCKDNAILRFSVVGNLGGTEFPDSTFESYGWKLGLNRCHVHTPGKLIEICAYDLCGFKRQIEDRVIELCQKNNLIFVSVQVDVLVRHMITQALGYWWFIVSGVSKLGSVSEMSVLLFGHNKSVIDSEWLVDFWGLVQSWCCPLTPVMRVRNGKAAFEYIYTCECENHLDLRDRMMPGDEIIMENAEFTALAYIMLTDTHLRLIGFGEGVMVEREDKVMRKQPALIDAVGATW
jgi:hypothetical protein